MNLYYDVCNIHLLVFHCVIAMKFKRNENKGTCLFNDVTSSLCKYYDRGSKL